MEAEEDQQCSKPGMSRKSAGRDSRATGAAQQWARDEVGGQSTYQGERQGVQGVVILGKPQQSMGGMAGEKLRDQAKAVDVRRDSSRHD